MSQTVPTAIAVIGIDIRKKTTMSAARSCCVRSGRAARWRHALTLTRFANRG